MPASSTQSAVAPLKSSATDIAEFLNQIALRNQSEPEFLQAVNEVAQDVLPFIADKQFIEKCRF